jgi:hypothetical protein
LELSEAGSKGLRNALDNLATGILEG